MKFYLNHLVKGDRVRARVVEILEMNQVIVNYRGDLLRVTNSTSRFLKIGDELDLMVSKNDPLEFQLYTKNPTKIDRIV